jgi:hypothetical protein
MGTMMKNAQQAAVRRNNQGIREQRLRERNASAPSAAPASTQSTDTRRRASIMGGAGLRIA